MTSSNGEFHGTGDHYPIGSAMTMDMGTMDDDDATPQSDIFCTGGMGMVMYMEGFQWTLKGEGSCLNLFFQNWTLDTKNKFLLALVGVILLGAATEGISLLRHQLNQKARQASYVVVVGEDISGNRRVDRRRQYIMILQTFLHGLHALTGYFLMLATMTFSLELLLAVLVGLMLGYMIFGGDAHSNVTTNPCCAFLEDDETTAAAAITSMEPRNAAYSDHQSARVSDELEARYSLLGTAHCCEGNPSNSTNIEAEP